MSIRSLGSKVKQTVAPEQERHERPSLTRIRVAELFAVPGVVRHRPGGEIERDAPREDGPRASGRRMQTRSTQRSRLRNLTHQA